MTAMTRRLVAAAALGVVVRVSVALAWPSPPVKDAAEYHGLALRLAEGRGYVREDGSFTAFRPPGFPLFLAAVYRVCGERLAAARLAQALLGGLAVVPIGLLGASLGGPGVGSLAAFAAAVYPPFVTSWFGPRALLGEVLLTTLAVTALGLTVAAAKRTSPGLAVLAGLTAGLSALTKGTLLFLPLLLAGYLAVAGARRGLGKAMLVVAASAVVMLPWMVRNRIRLGGWVAVSTNGGISLWASYNPASRGLGNADEGYARALAEDEMWRREGVGEIERSRRFAERALAEMAAHPGRAVKLALRKVLLFWDPTLKDWSRADPALAYNLGYAMALPLAVVGVWWTLDCAVARLLVGFVLVVALEHILIHVDVRYRVVLETALLVFAAAGAAGVADRLGGKRAGWLGAGYAAVHGVIAWRYDAVFSGLSRLVHLVGLG